MGDTDRAFALLFEKRKAYDEVIKLQATCMVCNKFQKLAPLYICCAPDKAETTQAERDVPACLICTSCMNSKKPSKYYSEPEGSNTAVCLVCPKKRKLLVATQEERAGSTRQLEKAAQVVAQRVALKDPFPVNAAATRITMDRAYKEFKKATDDALASFELSAQLSARDKQHLQGQLDHVLAELDRRVDPAELDELVEPAESADPAEPAGPADHADPADPAYPAEHVEPAEHVQPVESAEPADPAEDVQPVQPVISSEGFDEESWQHMMQGIADGSILGNGDALVCPRGTLTGPLQVTDDQEAGPENEYQGGQLAGVDVEQDGGADGDGGAAVEQDEGAEGDEGVAPEGGGEAQVGEVDNFDADDDGEGQGEMEEAGGDDQVAAEAVVEAQDQGLTDGTPARAGDKRQGAPAVHTPVPAAKRARTGEGANPAMAIVADEVEVVEAAYVPLKTRRAAFQEWTNQGGTVEGWKEAETRRKQDAKARGRDKARMINDYPKVVRELNEAKEKLKNAEKELDAAVQNASHPLIETNVRIFKWADEMAKLLCKMGVSHAHIKLLQSHQATAESLEAVYCNGDGGTVRGGQRPSPVGSDDD